jgi:hypothetical protein
VVLDCELEIGLDGIILSEDGISCFKEEMTCFCVEDELIIIEDEDETGVDVIHFFIGIPSCPNAVAFVILVFIMTSSLSKDEMLLGATVGPPRTEGPAEPMIGEAWGEGLADCPPDNFTLLFTIESK